MTKNDAYAENNTIEFMDIQPSAGIITFYVMLFIILELLGNCLLSFIVIYEKHGLPSLKRTIINQLVSSMCVVMIVNNLVVMPLSLYNIIIGLQSKFTLKKAEDFGS